MSDIQAMDSFDKMGLSDDILRGIHAKGYEKPTEIQESAIPILLESRDLIAQAQSGTGKTAAFVLGCLSKIDVRNRNPQALILVDTNFLAQQIFQETNKLTAYMKDFKSSCFVGGRHARLDKDDLKQPVHLVVGTPGRIEQLVREKALRLDSLRILIIDEADKMLSEKGISDSIKRIFSMAVPKDTQVAIFSATMKNEIVNTAEQFMRDPVRLLLHRKDVVVTAIQQYFVHVEEQDKLDVLCDLCEEMCDRTTMVFCNKKSSVEEVASIMKERGFSVAAIHSDHTPHEKDATLSQFKEFKVRILITTDSLARGIDIQQVSLVINHDYPRDHASYIHRIGRAGRFGRKGSAINLLSPRDTHTHDTLEKFYDIHFQSM
jgi:translation initiation factor 4A